MENPFQLIIDYLIEIKRNVGLLITLIKDISDKVLSSDTDEVLDFEATIKLLGVSKATLYKWTSEGIIPHNKPGGKLFFIREDLIQWIKSSKVKTKCELDEEAQMFIQKRNIK